MSTDTPHRPSNILVANFHGETVVLDLDTMRYTAYPAEEPASECNAAQASSRVSSQVSALGCAAEPMPLNPGVFGDPLVVVTI